LDRGEGVDGEEFFAALNGRRVRSDVNGRSNEKGVLPVTEAAAVS